MNCLECQERLQDFLDGMRPELDREGVNAHLRDCAPCRELFDAAELFRVHIGRLPQPQPSAHLSARIVSTIAQNRQRLRRWRWVSAAAAAVLLFGAGWWTARSLWKPESPAPVVQAPPTPLLKEGPASPGSPPSFHSQLDEARLATIGLTRAMAEDTQKQIRFLVPKVPEPALPSPVGPSPLPYREVTRTMANGLEPVTDSARRAWDMLWRLLPPPEPEKKGS